VAFLSLSFFKKLFVQSCFRQTDEGALIEVLCSRSNEEIKEIKACYAATYQRDLEKDLISETSGDFKKFLVSICQGNRPSNDAPIDMEKCRNDAKRLFAAGEGRWGVRCVLFAFRFFLIYGRVFVCRRRTRASSMSSSMRVRWRNSRSSLISTARFPSTPW
jgi:hypothetical protein